MRRKATLEDLLTMRSGIEWHESDRPLDSTNTTWQLENSPDWIRFTLRQPMDAERHLFAPLGISRYHWKLTPTGHPDTEGGLYL